jgi:hypothetical protein
MFDHRFGRLGCGWSLLLLAVVLEVGPQRVQSLARRSIDDDRSAFEGDDPVAQLSDELQGVGNEHDGPSLGLEPPDTAEALALERLVAAFTSDLQLAPTPPTQLARPQELPMLRADLPQPEGDKKPEDGIAAVIKADNIKTGSVAR